MKFWHKDHTFSLSIGLSKSAFPSTTDSITLELAILNGTTHKKKTIFIEH